MSRAIEAMAMEHGFVATKNALMILHACLVVAPEHGPAQVSDVRGYLRETRGLTEDQVAVAIADAVEVGLVG